MKKLGSIEKHWLLLAYHYRGTWFQGNVEQIASLVEEGLVKKGLTGMYHKITPEGETRAQAMIDKHK
jgi:predicted transcriptional regulator